MDRLRDYLKTNKDLGLLAETLANLLTRADHHSLLRALEKGDMVSVTKMLGVSQTELEQIFHLLKTRALALQKEYPDLAEFANAMKVAGSL